MKFLKITNKRSAFDYMCILEYYNSIKHIESSSSSCSLLRLGRCDLICESVKNHVLLSSSEVF